MVESCNRSASSQRSRPLAREREVSVIFDFLDPITRAVALLLFLHSLRRETQKPRCPRIWTSALRALSRDMGGKGNPALEQLVPVTPKVRSMLAARKSQALTSLKCNTQDLLKQLGYLIEQPERSLIRSIACQTLRLLDTASVEILGKAKTPEERQ